MESERQHREWDREWDRQVAWNSCFLLRSHGIPHQTINKQTASINQILTSQLIDWSDWLICVMGQESAAWDSVWKSHQWMSPCQICLYWDKKKSVVKVFSIIYNESLTLSLEQNTKKPSTNHNSVTLSQIVGSWAVKHFLQRFSFPLNWV